MIGPVCTCGGCGYCLEMREPLPVCGECGGECDPERERRLRCGCLKYDCSVPWCIGYGYVTCSDCRKAEARAE